MLDMKTWTFLTNHAYVLLLIAEDQTIRLRDVATKAGITERAAQRIVADLADGGYLTRKRVGRRNVYTVHRRQKLRHELGASRDIGSLLDVLMD